jgi:uncharacterized protein YggE
MLRRAAVLMLAVLAVVAFSTAVRAEGPGGGTVSATGEATVKVLPSALRVELQLQCGDRSLDAAMKQLKQRRESALAKLKTLKADADSIRASTPTVTKSVSVYPTPYSSPGSPLTWSPAAVPYDPYGPPAAVPRTFLPATDAASPVAPPPSLVPVPVAPPPAPAVVEPDEAPAPEPPSYRPSSPSPAVPPAGTYTPPAATPAYPTPAYATPVFMPDGWYSVTMTITADWPLEGKDIETLTPEVEKLQAKILAADLRGERPTGKPTAAGGESKEEAARPIAPVRPAVSSTPASYSAPSTPSYAPASPYGSTPPPSSGYSPATYCAPGMPCSVMPCGVAPPSMTRFVCALKLPDQQRKAALAEAFGKAKTQAAELAEAAGGKLGPVATLSRFVAFTPCNPAPGCPSDYSPYVTPVCYPPAARGTSEAVTNQPAEIEFHIQIQAQFRIE